MCYSLLFVCSSNKNDFFFFFFFTAPRIVIGPHTPEEIDHDVEIMSDGVEETYPMRPTEPDSVSEVSEVSRTNSDSESGTNYHNQAKFTDGSL